MHRNLSALLFPPLAIVLMLFQVPVLSAQDRDLMTEWMHRTSGSLFAVALHSGEELEEEVLRDSLDQLRHSLGRHRGIAVISVSSPGSETCEQPAWSNHAICFEISEIQRIWKVDVLPEILLYTWNGEPLGGGLNQGDWATAIHWAENDRFIGVALPQGDVGLNSRDRSRHQKFLLTRLGSLARARVLEAGRSSKLFQGLPKRALERTCSSHGSQVPDQILLVPSYGKLGDKKRVALSLLDVQQGCTLMTQYREITEQDWETGLESALEALLLGIRKPIIYQVITPPFLPADPGAEDPSGGELGDQEPDPTLDPLGHARWLETRWLEAISLARDETLSLEERRAAIDRFLRLSPLSNPFQREAAEIRQDLEPKETWMQDVFTIGLVGGTGTQLPGLIAQAPRFHYRFMVMNSLLAYAYKSDAACFGIAALGIGADYKLKPLLQGLDLGAMLYPLSFFAWNHSSADRSFTGFFNAQIYLRYSATAWHGEAGLLLPLLWRSSPGEEYNKADFGVYQGPIPLVFYLAAGL